MESRELGPDKPDPRKFTTVPRIHDLLVVYFFLW